MAIDALSLSLLLTEQRNFLMGGKINKVFMPEKDEVVLTIFNKKTYKLLFSCNNNVNRVVLTQTETKNPLTAPSFCMLLRKHLLNGTILDIAQQPFERVVDYKINTKNDLGYSFEVHLIFEPTGRDSNLILTDANYKIIDSLRHFSCDLQTARIILPNANYKFFPPQDKLLPTQTEQINIEAQNCCDLRQFLRERILGISPSTAQEIYVLADKQADKIAKSVQLYLDKLENNPQPNILFNNKTPTEVLPHDYKSKLGNKVFFHTLNEAHDRFYGEKNKIQRFNEKAKSVSTNLKNALARTEKKLGIQKQAILEAEKNTENKLFGDLILSNLHIIKKNMTEISVVNYFEPDAPTIKIPLDPSLSPQQNAQVYYKKYAKQKSSLKYNTKLVEENTQLLQYLKGIAKNLTFCDTDNDLAEIIKELSEKKIIKNTTTPKDKKHPPHITTPLHYNIEGFDVFVGKNNIQNDYITFKLAKPKDLWLHTQKIHSSHAIITNNQNTTIPDIVLLKTAEIVANFSQAEQGTKVPVDFCLKKYVKKPSGAPYGFVVYTDFSTILVNPDKHIECLISKQQ